MTYKPVGIDENGKLPSRAHKALSDAFASKEAPALGRFVAGLNQAKSSAVNIAFFGSSSVAGSNASTTANRYVDRFMKDLQAAYPNGGTEKNTITMGFGATAGAGLQGKNFGVGGTTASDYYFRSTFGQQITDLQPFAIFHMVGSNDWANQVAPGTYKANLLAAIADIDTRVTRPHVHFLLHAFRRSDSPAVNSSTDWEDYREIMRDIAFSRPNDIAFIDLCPIGDANDASATDPLGIMDTDLIHPTDFGHLLIKEGLVRSLGIKSSSTASSGSASVVQTGARITTDTFWRGTSPVPAVSAATDILLGGTAVTPSESFAGPWNVVNGVLEIGATLSFLGYPTAVQDLEISAVVKSITPGTTIMLNSRRAILASGGSGQARVAIDGQLCQLEFQGGRIGNVHPYKIGDRIGIRSKGDVHNLLINGVIVETRVFTSGAVSTYYGVAVAPAGGATGTLYTIDDMIVTGVN